MIDEEVWMDINALHRQGHTYAQIGRMVGRDWRTVKRYLTANSAKNSAPYGRSGGWQKRHG